MRTRTITLVLFGYALAAAGLLVPFWPLALGGVVVTALSGSLLWSLLVSIVIDLLYGTPTGMLHVLRVPFTLLALVIVVFERYSAKYFISEASEYL